MFPITVIYPTVVLLLNDDIIARITFMLSTLSSFVLVELHYLFLSI